MPSAKYLEDIFQDMPSARKTSDRTRIVSSIGAYYVVARGFNPWFHYATPLPSAGPISSFGNGALCQQDRTRFYFYRIENPTIKPRNYSRFLSLI
ncbi:MAG: hypothetical protein CL554_08630 [Algoriphagus sp.]|jgi:hypothetical protein|nr:hypothetical protein [Algoriphagus sp.]MAN85904.1 hypothetical protein [Algoriphagus sp.]HAD52857.1 hypothetical protein [Algoriphagus sp.]